MDAIKLKAENERLKRQVAQSQKRAEKAKSKADKAEQELRKADAQHTALVKQFEEALEDRNAQIELLQHRIKMLLKTIRGSRQERIDPDQLMLFSLEELQQLAEELDADQEKTEDDQHEEEDTGSNSNTDGRRKRNGFPKNMLREIIKHELSAEERRCPCCGEDRKEIGFESSQQLEFTPAQWKAIEHQRFKYACRCCEENIAIADKPPQPIEKGLPGPGLCAFTTLSKFGDHTPLYRQEDIHSRGGYPIRRSTLCNWLGGLAELVTPLVMRMKYLVLQSSVIHTDDTKIKMVVPGQQVASEAKFWPYLGDWLHPYAVYDFTVDRKRAGPENFLSGYQGYLQADAYSGYDCVYAGNDVLEVACWMHARRYWHEAIDNDPGRANMALGFIARLSQIEKELRLKYPRENLQGLRDFDGVASARKEHSRPLLDEFRAWMDTEFETGRILPKSLISKAYTYTNNQWDALCRYVDEGYLSMDNNSAERLVKLPAIGRKNFLFVMGKKGGKNAAMFYSLVSSAKANGVEPFAWLRDVYTRLPYHRDGEAFSQSASGDPVTSTELDELLPDRWLNENPMHVWTIDEVRRKERQRTQKLRRKRRRKR